MLVYTSLYGGHDTPKPPRPHPAVVEWRLYTDDARIYAPGWNVVVEPRSDGHPRMRAKFRKCHPPRDAARTLYLDASIRLRDGKLVDHALEFLSAGAEWACYPHPERTTIAEEIEASLGMPKYRGLEPLLREQLKAYGNLSTAWGGLWAAGILARQDTERVRRAGADWYAQCLRWTYQDQVSLPIVLGRHRIHPAPMTLGGSLWQNPHFTVEPHRSDQ